jgi:O-antigen ligase
MKNIFLIDDTPANKISYYHLMVILAVMPFDQFYSHLVFGSFALHTLINLQKNRLKQLLRLQVLLLQAVFFITLISCCYTNYAAGAAIDVTRQLVILLFPVFFVLTDLDIKKYRDNLMMAFTIICAATIVYLYLHAFIILRYFHLPFKVLFSRSLISHNFSVPINMHATFFSLQISLAFFYLLSLVIKGTTNKLIYTIGALILLAGIIQLSSKAIFMAILLALNIAVPYFLISSGKRLKYILITTGLSIIVILGVLRTNSFRERYVTDLKNDLTATPTIPDETVEPRIIRWKAALEVAQTAPIIGHGAGSELPVLQDEYFHKKLFSAYVNRLNAHNQYITFLITTGIIGLLVYLATLYYGVDLCFRRNDVLFFVFLLLVAMVSLSESMLNAEKGIWFYAFFLSFFVFSGTSLSNKKNL